jgi:hypothetical protein
MWKYQYIFCASEGEICAGHNMISWEGSKWPLSKKTSPLNELGNEPVTFCVAMEHIFGWLRSSINCAWIFGCEHITVLHIHCERIITHGKVITSITFLEDDPHILGLVKMSLQQEFTFLLYIYELKHESKIDCQGQRNYIVNGAGISTVHHKIKKMNRYTVSHKKGQ